MNLSIQGKGKKLSISQILENPFNGGTRETVSIKIKQTWVTKKTAGVAELADKIHWESYDHTCRNTSHSHKRVNMKGTIFMFFASRLHSRYHEVTCQWFRAHPTSICYMMTKRTTFSVQKAYSADFQYSGSSCKKQDMHHLMNMCNLFSATAVATGHMSYWSVKES